MDSDVERVLTHRLRAHLAALRMVAELGHPAVLRVQLVATQARLAELRAIMEELR